MTNFALYRPSLGERSPIIWEKKHHNGFVTDLVSAPVLGRIFPGEVRRLSSPCEEVELFGQIGQKISDINKVLTSGQYGCSFPRRHTWCSGSTTAFQAAGPSSILGVCMHNFHTRIVNSLYFTVLNLYEPAQGGLHPDFFLTLTSKTSSGAHRYCDT